MRNNRKKKRIKFIIFAVFVTILALIFVIQNFRDQIVFFYSPSELFLPENYQKTKNKAIRVGGLVVKGSVQKKDGLTVKFEIEDGKKNLKIIHKGIVPDLFREGQGVVAKGVYDKKNRVFLSSEMLVKHDEKYMPPEVAKSIDHKLKTD